MPQTQKCPICLAEVARSARYPKYVCQSCATRAADETGRPLKFFNETLTGGFLAFYADTHEKRESHVCWIDGVKCRADEDYYGGIVIQPAAARD
jgi:protein-arginine kinase activator protein McsA